MKVYLISDTHFNHANIVTYCQRPADFTELIIQNWQQCVKQDDLIIHLGDVAIGNRRSTKEILARLPGRKILIRGNHDRQDGHSFWIEMGFAFSCDGLIFRRRWLTHEPATILPDNCTLNIHGHWHNIWHGFAPEGDSSLKITKPLADWQRLFAVEYTDYRPIEFEKFVNHPDKYLARGLK